MTVLIVAFDGVLAYTLDARADAIREVAGSAGVADPVVASESRSAPPSAAAIDGNQIRALLPGRTLHEVLRLLLPTADETTLDLCTIRARQHVTARLAHGVDLASGVGAFVERAQATSTTLVLRSDSARGDVERLLSLCTLDHAFTFLRCADDPTVTTGSTLGAPSIDASYAAITRRLDARGASADRTAIEASEFAASVAQTYVGRARVGSMLG